MILMRVLLVNGSPHEQGCTYTALMEVAKALEAEGVETELFQLGRKPVRGCVACGGCAGKGRCVFDDDVCNRLIERMQAADGLVVGSPVYYAGPNGSLCALLDRLFYSSAPLLRYKPAASVAVCRRGGASATFDRLNKYFMMSCMPVVSSQYWNSVHGHAKGEAEQDAEGLQTMRTLGRNMAWGLKSLKNGGQPRAEREGAVKTGFIR